jgi:acyl carrier protein
MENSDALKERIKALIVENLMLQITPQEIGDDQALFGPGSLGLDSVDALQLVVALDKNFSLKIPDPNAAKEVLQSVNTIVAAISKV